MSAITVNLFLGVFWLMLGIALLAHHYLSETPVFLLKIGQTLVPPGWLALVLAGYNFLRLGFIRSWIRRRAREEAELAQRRREHQEGLSAPRTPDPNFQFTDPPPSP